MENPIVLLNFVPEDKAAAEKLKDGLVNCGFSVVMPGETTSLQATERLIKEIETVAEKNGLMVLVLTKNAIHDNLFISNTQYFCELAGKRQTLLICKMEEVPRENPVALYYPRAITINASSDETKWMPKVEESARRLAGLLTSSHSSPRRISKRAIQSITWIVASLAILGGIGSFFMDFYNERQAIIEAAKAAAQEPVVINEPFQNESIDQGLIVDQRFLPSYVAAGDPSAEAPFSKEPAFVSQRLTFDDPRFENTIDNSMIGFQNVSIREEDFKLINQQNDVLHIAATTSEEIKQKIFIPIKYFYSVSDVSYMGIRFRIEDYQGWSDIDKPMGGYIGTDDFPLGILDLSKQTISNGDKTVFLGTTWHALESVIDADTNTITVLLDGEELAKLHELPASYDLTYLFFQVSLDYSTDWASLDIDEIVYGGDAPVSTHKEPEDAIYNFTVDDPIYENSFSDLSINQYITSNQNAFSVEDGKLQVHFNQGLQSDQANIRIPTEPITETNYYSLKYRIVDTPNKYWTYNGFLDISIQNMNFDDSTQLSCQTSLHSSLYRIQTSPQEMQEIVGSVDNFQAGLWHTMEIVIVPTTENNNFYTIQFWHDNILMTEKTIENPDLFTDDSSPLFVGYSIYPGDLSFGPITVEIDEITRGFLPESELLKRE